MEKYKDVIEAALHLAQELAKHTATPWDDTIAATAHDLFHQLVGPHLYEGRPVVATAAPAALPPAVLLLISLAAQWLLSRLNPPAPVPPQPQ